VKYEWIKRFASELDVGDYFRPLGPAEPALLVEHVETDPFKLGIETGVTFKDPDEEFWSLQLDEEGTCMLLKYVSDQALLLSLLAQKAVPLARRVLGDDAHVRMYHAAALLHAAFMSGPQNIVNDVLGRDGDTIPQDESNWRYRVWKADHRDTAAWYEALQEELRRPLTDEETATP